MQTVLFNTKAGNFNGFTNGNVVNVLGVRYATAKRFEPPVAYVYPRGVHDCFEPAPFCVQNQPKIETYLYDIDYDVLPQVEDPLYLSLTIPKDRKDGDKLPVMVWIHGGAYRNGGCDASYLDRSLLCNEGNVIVIGINYRLSVFGFVKDKDGNFANLGLLDIIEGLKWVQNNIEVFGGDKDNVTIFGQSAGADAVRCIMLSENTDDLYKRAIIQSDPLSATKNRTDLDNYVKDKLNEYPLDADADEMKKAILEITNGVTEKGDAKHMIFAAHYGVFPMVKEEEIETRLREVAAKHDLLIGSNLREVSVYVARNSTVRKLDKCFITKPIINGVIKKKSAQIFGKPSLEFAKLYARLGGNSYYYSFSWTENKSFLGACHTLDLLLLFGAKTAEGKDSAMGLTAKEINEKGKPMRKIWTDFAASGRINQFSIPGIIKIDKVKN